MIKKVIAILVAAISLLALSGCQLAVNGKGTAANTDELCGMFITFKPLDTLGGNDMAAVLNGVTHVNDCEEKPIYAKAQGYGDGMLKYKFEGIEGIPFFEVCEKRGGGDGNTWVNCSDDSVDVKVSIEQTDTNEKNRFEGTLYLYLSPDTYGEDGNCIIYCNPVYETSEDEVYMLPAESGSGLGIVGDPLYDASQLNMSTSLSGTATVKTGNETKSKTIEASVSILGIKNIQKYELKEMSAQDTVISSIEIKKDNIPGSTTLDDKTAYSILEAYSIDKGGATVIDRSLVDMSLNSFSVRFPGETGFAKKYNIIINNKPV